MRGLLLLLFPIALWAPPQDAPAPTRKITLPASGKFSTLADGISKQASIPLTVDPGVEDREIRVDVKERSFFEALDALCRAHGEANYMTRPDDGHWESRHLRIGSRAWVEFPTVYVGDFKVVLAGTKRDVTDLESGRVEHQEMMLALFPPPTSVLSGDPSSWKIAELKDGRGADLLAKGGPPKAPRPDDEDPDSSLSKLHLDVLSPRLAYLHRLECLPFRREAGLAVLAGRIDISVADQEDVRIPLEKGRETPIPGGACTVVEVTPVKVHGRTESRATLRFRFDDAARKPESAVGNMGTHDDAEESWDFLSPTFQRDLGAFQLRAEAPAWILLRVSKPARPVSLPFRFPDPVIKGGK